VKNFSIILNVILTFSVIILFFLHFNAGKGAEKTQDISSENSDSTEIRIIPKDSFEGMTVAFVNTDSILANYKYFKELSKRLEAQSINAENQLQKKYKDLEEEYKNLLTKIDLGLISKEAAEQEFSKKQMEFEEFRANERERILRKEQELTESLYDSIVIYINRHNKKSNYNYVLGYSRGGGILYADDSYDLTKEVLNGLNREYDLRKKK